MPQIEFFQSDDGKRYRMVVTGDRSKPVEIEFGPEEAGRMLQSLSILENQRADREELQPLQRKPLDDTTDPPFQVGSDAEARVVIGFGATSGVHFYRLSQEKAGGIILHTPRLMR